MTYGAEMNIPNTYASVPPEFTEGYTTYAELQAVGFHRGVDVGEDKPGEPPVDEMIVEGPQVIETKTAMQLMRHSDFKVLRDSDGNIVATWDEGRWWTPEESDEFTRRVVEANA